MIITRTPFRISFCGGGSDYPWWVKDHIGMTLGATIDKYCWLTVDYAPRFLSHRYRVVYSKIEQCPRIEDIQHPAVRATLEYLGITEGVEILHAADLPSRSGVASSSAFVVGLLAALHGALGQHRTCLELAKEATNIERNLLGEPVGNQDQILTAFGGLNQIVFHPAGETRVRQLDLSPARLAALHERLFLFYVGPRRGGHAPASQFDAVKDNAANVTAMQRLAQTARDGADILTGGDVEDFGPLLHESWEIKRRLWADASTERIDSIYSTCREAGATGGKLLGAGGGGFMLFFAPPERHRAIREAWTGLTHVPFQFETQGVQVVAGA